MNLRLTFLVASVLACLHVSVMAADDPIQGFVSVEPFEVRLEAIVKVGAFRNTWRLEGESIQGAGRQAILENVATLLESGVTVESPGREVVFSGKSVRFVQLDPEKGYLTDEREEIPIEEALVGITLSSDARNVRELNINWLWFAPEQERLILEIASRGKPSARFVTPAKSRVSWKLDEAIQSPTLLAVPEALRVTKSPARYLIFLGIAMLVAAAIAVIRFKQKAPPWVGWLTIGGVACGFLSFKIQVNRVVLPGNESIEEVTYVTLRNIYHAFDYRDEVAIYDTLEKSVMGPLLERIYLEIRQSLELENAGGPRVRVYEIALRDCKQVPLPAESEGDFVVQANWATIGEVTHWGHTHERTNRYEARLTFSAPKNRWKVTDLDLLNEERMQKVSRRFAQPEAEPEAVTEPEAETKTEPAPKP